VRNEPPVDFIFIDGDHSWAGIDADWKSWSTRIAPGGVIALHDSRPSSESNLVLESVRYTQEVIRGDPRFQVIEEVHSLTVLQANTDSRPPDLA
jgi:hypothetical protein